MTSGASVTRRVLVAYASAHGSTRGVAQRIADRLASHGLGADARDVDVHDGADGFDAVVLGSAIQGSAWLPQAVSFARRNEAALGARPVWLFSVGLHPSAGSHRGPFRRLIASAVPTEVPELQVALDPVEHRAFAGALSPAATTGAEWAVFRLMGGRYGDFRSWGEIDAWADGIARHLLDPAVG